MKYIVTYFPGTSGNFMAKVVSHTLMDSDFNIHINDNGSCHYVEDRTCYSPEYSGSELVIRCHTTKELSDLNEKLLVQHETCRIGRIIRHSQEEGICSAMNQYTKHFCDADMWDKPFMKSSKPGASPNVLSDILSDYVFNTIKNSKDRSEYSDISKYVYITASKDLEWVTPSNCTMPFSAIMQCDAQCVIQFVSELIEKKLTANQEDRIAKWLSDYRAKQNPLWWDTPLQYYAEITQKFKEDIAKLNNNTCT